MHSDGDHAGNDVAFALLHASRCCAWCLAEQGKAMGTGSHGICERHSALVLERYQQKKRLSCPPIVSLICQKTS